MKITKGKVFIPIAIEVETETDRELLLDTLKVAAEEIGIDYGTKHPRYLFVLNLLKKLRM